MSAIMILRLIAIIHWLPFAISIETADGVIIKEVCVPHQIAELERYLEEHDLPEVPISNTATYTSAFDNDAIADAGKIGLVPFGELTVDWKRLRLLQELLISPEDQELKSKLLVLSEILFVASQRVRNYSNRPKQGSTPRSKPGRKIVQDPKKGDEEISSTPNSKTASTRIRFQRSTHRENAMDEDQDFSFSSSAGTETPLEMIDGFSEAPDLEEDIDWSSKTDIPQLEEVEEKFKDNYFVEEVEGPFDQVATGRNSSSISDGNSGSKEVEGKKDLKNSYTPGGKITPETINEIKSPRRGAAEATTEEIKPDVRNEDLEMIGTLSKLLTTIDKEKLPSSTTSGVGIFENLGKIGSSTPSGGEKDFGNSQDSETTVSSSPKSFLVPKKAPEGVLKIVTADSAPFLIKKDNGREGWRHVSRMHNFDDGERGSSSSRIDSSTEYSFYDRNEKPRSPGQESPLIFSGDKLLAFRHLGRPAAFAAATPSTGRHEKRAGIDTDVEKLYRWFYRGGEGPEKSDPRGDLKAVIKCKNRRS